MSDFSNFQDAMLVPHSSGKWELYQDLPFDIVHGNTSTRIIIPKGYLSDGASIPIALRWAFDRGNSKYMKAALLHDYMLEQGYTPHASADAFQDALLAAGFSKARVYTMWWGVFLWTTFSYPNNSKEPFRGHDPD